MADYETGYQALDMYSVDPDEHDETPPTENIVQLPDQNKGSWGVLQGRMITCRPTPGIVKCSNLH